MLREHKHAMQRSRNLHILQNFLWIDFDLWKLFSASFLRKFLPFFQNHLMQLKKKVKPDNYLNILLRAYKHAVFFEIVRRDLYPRIFCGHFRQLFEKLNFSWKFRPSLDHLQNYQMWMSISRSYLRPASWKILTTFPESPFRKKNQAGYF